MSLMFYMVTRFSKAARNRIFELVLTLLKISQPRVLLDLFISHSSSRKAKKSYTSEISKEKRQWGDIGWSCWPACLGPYITIQKP